MKLELDFAFDRARRARRWRFAVAILGLLLGVQGGMCAWRYQVAVSGLHDREEALRIARRPMVVAAQMPNAEVVAQVREMVDRLAFPWDLVFAALESVQVSGVVIDAIEQHAPQRSQNAPHRVVVRLHASNFQQVLEWLRGLEKQPALQGVSLLSESMREPGRLDAVVSATCAPGFEQFNE